ncbi:zinc ribbon domain-containing protein [Pseudothauera rhizosphaerae]|uniref:Zinc ribbon domain-containing protein n=1 Tax=Pseudothauera rhizosphaerae TaxID=2565932 RepID=A0A4S4ANZ2_9RHOO|nr:zinc ribbon domain-containing protein [Pseudothauera rhizosphaerae]THF60954.1 zinc ribbon domain-containing protein [Pseudothauera rhizosphaerae]
MSEASPTRQASGLLDLLLRAGDAWRNWRALALLAATAALFVLLTGLGSAGAARGNILLTLFATLVGLGVLDIGIGAAGVLLWDQAAGGTPRGLRPALVDGFHCALRFLLLAVGAVVLTALFSLAVTLLLLLCRIPVLGVALYAVLFPLLALMSAFYFAAWFPFFVLVGPALWSGATLRQAIARLYALISRKPAQAVVSVILLAVLVFVLSLVLFGAASYGVLFVSGLSASVLDFGAGFGSLLGRAGGAGSGPAIAGMIGGGLVYGLVGAAIFAATILGSCHIYLHLTADMDFSEADAALAEGVRKAREQAARLKHEAERRAREAQEEVRRRAEAARTAAAERKAEAASAASAAPLDLGPAEPPPTEPGLPADAAGTTTVQDGENSPPLPASTDEPACPACGAGIDSEDAFCGNCGHRLRPTG